MDTNIYSRGGRLKKGKMVIAHFNPQELNSLDYMQGKKETCPRTGMRSYSHLEELLKNPHLLRGLIQSVEQGVVEKRAKHAKGGQSHDYHSTSLNEMADKGIHGDTELGLIGPHTKNVLDHLVSIQGYPVENNHHTGHPHYGFLDGIIGGLGNILTKIPVVGPTIGNLAKTYLPSLIPAAGQLAQKYLPKLGEKFGGASGARFADMAGNFLNNAAQRGATPEQLSRAQQMTDRASQLGERAYDSYQRGGIQGAARDLGGGALSQIGQYLPGQMGQMAGQFGQDVSSGQGFRQMYQGAKDRLSGGEPMDWRKMAGSLAERMGQYGNQALQGASRGQSLQDIGRGIGGRALHDVSDYVGGDMGRYGNQFASGVEQGQQLPQLAGDVGTQAFNDYMPERLY